MMVGVEKGTFELPTYYQEIISFIALSTMALYWFTTRKMGMASSDFAKIYLGATVLRILFFGGFIFAIIQLDPSSARGNASLFLVCYFLFTILEVVVLFKELNSRKSSGGGQKDR
jgi:hypothetical protein